ncbi:hypothetical protein [Streptomyces sp. cf386]|uniref:hypothetical protein n=1 Tax=Streptomyces sp. cf386 TaxID=1761904 RepID=UPI00210A95C6|nr:hypothetical protein [Streptomyces sp. cf386]
MALEGLPRHGRDGGPDLVGRHFSFPGADAPVVPAQLAFDVLDVLAEFDEFVAVFAGGGDQGVEHGDDGLAEDVGDAPVDVVVERADLCGGGRVFHRLCARQVLHVEEVHTRLTCDFAVSEEHGDVEDGSAGEQR